MRATNLFALPRARWARAATLVFGLVLSQAILFGPSLLGHKLLLPLELLASPRIYLPNTPGYSTVQPGSQVFSDQILEYELNRRFASAELHAGRIPLWNPYGYTGAPFANFYKYSPFMWLYYLFDTPTTLAWIQLLTSLVAGVGAYLFFRRALDVSFWPAAVGAWCYPLTGFFVLWQGFSLTYVTAWVPWLLLATDQTVRQPARWGGPALAVCTCLVLISGQVDVAGQALLASGIYALWCWFDVHRLRVWTKSSRVWTKGGGLTAAGAVLGAWTVGILLSTPYLLPLEEYARTGVRYAARISGGEERPPIGVSALPQLVIPDVYGSSREGALYIATGNQLEGPAAAYSGLLLTFLVAPLGWRSRRHRSKNLVLGILALVALGWTLDVPGLVQILRLPGMNIMSHNRFVFAFSFSIVSMAVVGLEVLREGRPLRRWWLIPAALVPLVLGSWCLYHAFHLPEPIATGLEEALRNGRPVNRAGDLDAIQQIQQTFRHTYLRGALLCGLTLLGWLAISTRVIAHRGFVACLAVALWGELLLFAYGFNPQSDPKLYYPSIPVLEKLAAASHDRVMGAACLPPNLNERFGFRDVRGYDGVDPALLVELLDLASAPNEPRLRHARTQWLVPVVRAAESGDLAVSPVLSLLNVRYLIFRGSPPQNVRPYLREDDYWIGENKAVLPRPFIPRRVERVATGEETLRRLADPTFDPREVAFVDADLNLPASARGFAEIVAEHPTQIAISLDMQTPGLVILSDLWDRGWRASLDGTPAPILRANHALRGVVAPAGRSTLQFAYRPRSFVVGFWLMAGAGLALLAWVSALFAQTKRRESARARA